MRNVLVTKLITLTLVGTLCFGLVGCGKSQDATTSNEDETIVGDVEFPEDEESAKLRDILEEEDSEDAIFGYANDVAPDIDIEGCDTFTQIIDQKLTPGMGYANVDIGDVNALIVCSGAYDNLDGNMAAIDGAIYIYKDGAPYLAGKVCSGGTAYPLAIKDGKLMSASNHWAAKYLIVDDQLIMIEHGAVEYDTNGNARSTYNWLDDYIDGSEKSIDDMFEEMGEGEIINFDVIQ